jgi:hypothetical protein
MTTPTGADLLFWLGASWLILQLTGLAPLVELLIDVVRRRIAIRRVHLKWARFRHEHPEAF